MRFSLSSPCSIGFHSRCSSTLLNLRANDQFRCTQVLKYSKYKFATDKNAINLDQVSTSMLCNQASYTTSYLSNTSKDSINTIYHGNRQYSTSTQTPIPTKNELLFTEILTKELEAEHVLVNDISGGCGSMYRVQVVSKHFNGIPLVKQHQMVYGCLKEYIPSMHGLTMMTKTPEQYKKILQQRQSEQQ